MGIAGRVCFLVLAILLVSVSAKEEKREKNPYVFEDRHFTTGLKTQHGSLRILKNFAERSELLLGIGNYRVAVLEAQPQTFVVPNHLDADALVYVAQGTEMKLNLTFSLVQS